MGYPEHNELIILEVKDGIAVITLNIPSKLNALNYDLYVQLAEILRSINSRNDCYCTVLTGAGTFFSSGADVANRHVDSDDIRLAYLRRLGSSNMDLARSLYTHDKILIAALNGPAVGLSAALLGWFDFIYAVESAWILTPFSTIGLAAEGGASLTFPRRMGIAKANEALILGKKLGANELHATGFINKIFPNQPQEAFISSVLTYIQDKFSELDTDAALATKQLIKANLPDPDSANVREIIAGADRFATGRPEEQFRRLANKEKRHKL